MTEFQFLNLSELRLGLDSKEFSSSDLTKSCLARAEETRDLNSFIELCGERALDQAIEADKRIAKGETTPLLGIPLGIKDIIVTKNIRTSCGSRILSNFIPPYDATAIKKLKQQGAVIIGKNNMDEFGMGSSNENSFFGPVKNPWNKEHVPGGSSGGSAVAVAAGVVPASLGSDTGGSIRQPAAFCSLVGLKPTYGRVSRYGLIAYASSLDQIGFFTRTVRDAAIMSQQLAGKDPLDSTSVDVEVPDFSASLGKSIKGMRVGVPRQYFLEALDSEVSKIVSDAISHIKGLGAEIVEIDLPNTDAALAAYYIIAPAEASSNLARFDGIRYGYRSEEYTDLKELYSKTRSEGFGQEVKRRILVGTYVLSSGYIDQFYNKALKVRRLIVEEFNAAFEHKCDVIVSPTTPTAAFKLGEKTADPVAMYLNDIFTIPANLAGLPCMSIPCGFNSGGLPVGLQLIGKAWDEAVLLKLGAAYEESTDWHKKTPKID